MTEFTFRDGTRRAKRNYLVSALQTRKYEMVIEADSEAEARDKAEMQKYLWDTDLEIVKLEILAIRPLVPLV